RPRRVVAPALESEPPSACAGRQFIFDSMKRRIVLTNERATRHYRMRFRGVEKASILRLSGRPVQERKVSHCINGRTAASLWIIKWSPGRDVGATVGWHQSAAEMVRRHQSKVSNPLFSADSV